jgi:plastocyanin
MRLHPALPLVLAIAIAGALGVALAGPDPTPAPSTGTITGTVIALDDGKPAQRDDVYVYLIAEHAQRGRSLPGDGQDREIRQQGRTFIPHVVVAPVGTSVRFPNFDAEVHSVFSSTDPPGLWNLGRYATDHKGRAHVFAEPGEIDIFCDIHAEMAAKVKVVDSAWIARVQGDQFTFAGVPPGSYSVHAWAPDSVEVVDKVTVAAGATAKLAAELHLALGKPRNRTHRRSDKRPYCPHGYDDCD